MATTILNQQPRLATPEELMNTGNVVQYDAGPVAPSTPSGGGDSGSAGGTIYTGSATGGATAGDPNEVAYWNDQQASLRRLLGSVDTQKDQGLDRIGSSYSTTKGRTEDERAKAMRDYDITRQDTLTDKVGTLGQIDTGARTAYNSLQRLLGLSGAGRSSAAQQVVPYAVSRQAGQQRSGVTDAYGRNLRSIDIAQTDTKSAFEQALEDLLSEKQAKTEDFLRGIYQAQNELRERLEEAALRERMAGGESYEQARDARTPFRESINANLGRLDNLYNEYRAPRFDPRDVVVKKPELGKYTVDPRALRLGQQNPDLPAEVVNYLPFLKEEEETPAVL